MYSCERFFEINSIFCTVKHPAIKSVLQRLLIFFKYIYEAILLK